MCTARGPSFSFFFFFNFACMTEFQTSEACCDKACLWPWLGSLLRKLSRDDKDEAGAEVVPKSVGNLGLLVGAAVFNSWQVGAVFNHGG